MTPISNAHTSYPEDLLVTDWSQSFRLYHHPHAIWLDEYDHVGANLPKLKHVLDEAKARKQYPELVMYAIPIRDLGQSSEGGFDTFEHYMSENRWVAEKLAAFVKETGLTPRVYLEPDALGLALQYRLDENFSEESQRIYNERVSNYPALIRIYQKAGALVYMDIAHSGWFDFGDTSIKRLAGTLAQAGVAQADGLVSNISNRQVVKNESQHSAQNEHHFITELIKHLPKRPNGNAYDVVTDTSRNGGATVARQYYLADDGKLFDNETPEGRWVGYWKGTERGESLASPDTIRVLPFFGRQRTMKRLTTKEKYTFEPSTRILKAPPWLDAVGDVKQGPRPTDSPDKHVAGVSDVITRFRYIKPPDDCDGSLNCPPGQSKSRINKLTSHRQKKLTEKPKMPW